jgi:methylenetetrahydrofolate dehydrogenase (NADP+) / methenyltetrahydrofolate cyclohydrolase
MSPGRGEGLARTIDGAGIAARLELRAKQAAAELRVAWGFGPSLAGVFVGDHPESRFHVRCQIKHASEAGFEIREHQLLIDFREDEIIALIERLNADEAVDGIVVHLPLPKDVDSDRILGAVDPGKDIAGWHSVAGGTFIADGRRFVSHRAFGCMLLLRSACAEFVGQTAVVVGQSALVGKPVAILLLEAGCTVTLAHPTTRDLPQICRGADILVVAIDQPATVRGDWIRPGAIVVDAGAKLVRRGNKSSLMGDVVFAEACHVAGAITPVPGGVGPVAVACLLANTVHAAYARRSLPVPEGLQ